MVHPEAELLFQPWSASQNEISFFKKYIFLILKKKKEKVHRSHRLFVVLQMKDGSVGHASQQTSRNLRGEPKQKAKLRLSSV